MFGLPSNPVELNPVQAERKRCFCWTAEFNLVPVECDHCVSLTSLRSPGTALRFGERSGCLAVWRSSTPCKRSTIKGSLRGGVHVG
eukprot:8219588-Alexandrium_andersonii.AAC.1